MGRQTLDPKLDLVFKMLFGAPENRGLLLSLVNAVLAPRELIRSIQVLDADLPKEGVDDKGVALDLRVELESGEQVDVEMQTQPRPAQRARALYYWARLYSSQLGRGEHYDRLSRCVVVMICNFHELPTPRFHSTFRVTEVHDHSLLTEQLELHLLELPKVEDPLARNDEPALVAWGKFLVAATDHDLDELAMSDPVLRQARAALEKLSADPAARIRAEQRQLALDSYRIDISEAKAQGRAEGRAEGLINALLRVLAARFGELPSSVRVRIENASASEVSSLLDRAALAPSLNDVFEEVSER